MKHLEGCHELNQGTGRTGETAFADSGKNELEQPGGELPTALIGVPLRDLPICYLLRW